MFNPSKDVDDFAAYRDALRVAVGRPRPTRRNRRRPSRVRRVVESLEHRLSFRTRRRDGGDHTP
jgi:hypothetical protein